MALHWQEPEIELLVGLLPHLGDRTLVDVGAERGGFAAAVLRAGIESAHLIEPEPANVAALHARFDGDDRVLVHASAISDADHELELHMAATPSGEPIPHGHTVLTRPGGDEITWDGAITVQARSLSSLVSAGELPRRAGILKIDTEGHDFAAVQGMGQLECDIVMVEHWTDLPRSLGACPWTAEDMVAALGPRGFSHFVLVRHRGEAVLFRWDDAHVPSGEFANLVFVHDRVLDAVWPVILNCATACTESALERLEHRLQEVEADRQARLEVIERLDHQLKEAEADRQARLEVIERLDAELKTRSTQPT
jgi:FkbM family methyltransferase